jgi:hypothetical protein
MRAMTQCGRALPQSRTDYPMGTRLLPSSDEKITSSPEPLEEPELRK